MKRFYTVLLLLLLTGCSGAGRIDDAIEYHSKVAPIVQLGMSETAFRELMKPALLPNDDERQPQRFSRADSIYVVHFVRIARIPDDLLTDDEYTPYTFKDGKLVALGWDFLGGPKFTSQDLKQREAAADKTNVNVRQSTTVNTGNSSGGYCVPDLNRDGRCMGGPCC